MNNEINILLVDDHAVLRKGLAGLLAEVPGIRVVGEASDGEEAITQVRALKPDLVVMDISMPKLNGIQATRQITTEFPETKVIALSMHSGKRFIDDMLGAGAVGYLLKESAPEELIHCIRVVLQGDTYLSNVINDTIVSAYVDQISNQHAEDSEATFDILQSKLRRPAPAPSLILRTQLLENLDAGRVRPLTLVSAPAGYGKTVLVNTWLESGDWPRTWLLLEKSDSDLRQFVSYFVAAINNIFPTACENTIRLTSAPILPSVSSFATSLSNELDLINEPFHLVLDDYQCIDSMSPVQDLINQLLAHPPVPLHLVLLTRRDPPISLVVLRAQDQITEIRMHDLMFDISETRQLIQDTTSLDLTNNELNKVHFQLEGWPVGLRFLIWSMRQAGDSKQILGDLQGSGHQVREYLLHEVINQQSAQMQHWLLRTSILDKLCPALCDVVCSADDSEQPHDLDGQQFLDTLHRENFFVFALPSHADWFRYHRVFQDALREQLAHRIEPDQIASLHLRASAWFESQGLIKEAMQHALLAQNPIAAMEIAGRHQREELNKESWHIVAQWLAMLPAELRQQRLDLLLAQAWIAVFQHDPQAIYAIVEKAESLPKDTSTKDLYRDLTFFRGYVHYSQSEIEAALPYLDEAMASFPANTGALNGKIAVTYAYSLALSNRKELAIATLKDLNKHSESQDEYFQSRLGVGLMKIHLLSGDLTLVRMEAQNLQSLRGDSAAEKHYLLGCSHLTAYNLDEALNHFTLADEQTYSLPARLALDLLTALALTQQLMGSSYDAEQTLGRLNEYTRESKHSLALPIAKSCESRIALLQGTLESAVQWAHSSHPTPTLDDVTLFTEIPAITQARVLVAMGSGNSLTRAINLLQSIRQVTDHYQITCHTIETVLLQSIALKKQGFITEALGALQEAVALAEPRGWLRPFVELGQPMADLLEHLGDQQGFTDYLKLVLSQVSARDDVHSGTEIAGQSRTTGANSSVVDPLTNREIEILALLTRRLQNKEIAAQLFVSTETVKSHLKNLYQKLDVGNRREAAERASEILPSLSDEKQ